MPLFKIVFFTRYLAYLVDKHLKSHSESCKLWLSTWQMINITFCIGSEIHGRPFAFNIVTKISRFVFIYPIISHCEQQLERKYVAADENYSHTNVNFLYASITLLTKGELQHLWRTSSRSDTMFLHRCSLVKRLTVRNVLLETVVDWSIK